jgi:DNA-binding NtrC family response regulator
MNQKRILVIDDETTFLLSMKRLLNGPKFFVATAENLEEAMTLLSEHDFHIVITDIRLTNVMKKEGLEILQHIKRNKPCTTVVILTGYGNQEIMEKAYSLGANLYMEKPVPVNVLLRIIENQGCN